MTLGALVDAGAPLEEIHAAIQPMDIPGFNLTSEKRVSRGLAATKVHVEVAESPRHRNLSQVMDVVNRADLSDTVMGHASAAFRALAEAEARVHGKDPESIHFHEVGANDAIVDIVGSCLAIELLGLEQLACSRIVTGGGSFSCAHGTLPVPGPAAVDLLQGFEIEGGGIDLELVTPTGASLLKEYCGRTRPMPPMRLLTSGYGMGDHELPDRSNILRVLVGDVSDAARPSSGLEGLAGSRDEVMVLACDVDDMVPEWFGPLTEDLLAAGALDVTLAPVYMKKGRPGTHISVLAPVGRETNLARLLLAQSTTIGVRMTPASRYTLHREGVTVETPLGPVRGKLVWGHGAAPRWTPEFEDAKRIHAEKGVTMREVYRVAVEAAKDIEAGVSEHPESEEKP